LEKAATEICQLTNKIQRVDAQEGSANMPEVLRQLSASFFLVVMMLLIGLQLPALGYCAGEGTFFVGQHMIESDCQNQCCHDSPPVEIPCDEEHEFVTIDAGGFQWNPLIQTAPPVTLVPEDFPWISLSFVFEKQEPLAIGCVVEPPPPDLPIFRRDAALRL
jgi:hypothetical protein